MCHYSTLNAFTTVHVPLSLSHSQSGGGSPPQSTPESSTDVLDPWILFGQAELRACAFHIFFKITRQNNPKIKKNRPLC